MSQDGGDTTTLWAELERQSNMPFHEWDNFIMGILNNKWNKQNPDSPLVDPRNEQFPRKKVEKFIKKFLYQYIHIQMGVSDGTMWVMGTLLELYEDGKLEELHARLKNGISRQQEISKKAEKYFIKHGKVKKITDRIIRSMK